MVDQLTGRIDKMLAGTSHVKHRCDKENDQAENEEIKGDSSGNRRLPEATVRFNMLCGLHLGFPQYKMDKQHHLKWSGSNAA